jgi:hypothetical protein
MIVGFQKEKFTPHVCGDTMITLAARIASTRGSIHSASRVLSCSRSHLRTARRSSSSTTLTMAATSDSWPQEDTRRMLHAVYRVGPMDEYCKFMEACFGMKQLRYRDMCVLTSTAVRRSPCAARRSPRLNAHSLTLSLALRAMLYALHSFASPDEKYTNAFIGFGGC